MQDKISERSDTSMFADAIEKKKKRDNKRVKKAVLIVWMEFKNDNKVQRERCFCCLLCFAFFTH